MIISLPVSEEVDVVDEDDHSLFVTTVEECKNKGLLHRSVAVFLRNSGRKILLQRRGLTDDWLPGKWTISSTGHVRAGENPETAASRELQEELGIAAEPAFILKQLLPKIPWKGKIEYELAFVFDAISDGAVTIDPAEVEEVRFLSLDECTFLIVNRPEDLTPDAVILFRKYLPLFAEHKFRPA